MNLLTILNNYDNFSGQLVITNTTENQICLPEITINANFSLLSNWGYDIIDLGENSYTIKSKFNTGIFINILPNISYTLQSIGAIQNSGSNSETGVVSQAKRYNTVFAIDVSGSIQGIDRVLNSSSGFSTQRAAAVSSFIDTTDADDDGIFDIIETEGLMANGQRIYSDPTAKHSDNDNLEDDGKIVWSADLIPRKEIDLDSLELSIVENIKDNQIVSDAEFLSNYTVPINTDVSTNAQTTPAVSDNNTNTGTQNFTVAVVNTNTSTTIVAGTTANETDTSTVLGTSSTAVTAGLHPDNVIKANPNKAA